MLNLFLEAVQNGINSLSPTSSHITIDYYTYISELQLRMYVWIYYMSMIS